MITRKILECVCPVLGGECGLKTGRGWLTHLAVSVSGVEQDKPRQEGTVQLLGKQGRKSNLGYHYRLLGRSSKHVVAGNGAYCKQGAWPSG